jgi:hypothetical protein
MKLSLMSMLCLVVTAFASVAQAANITKVENDGRYIYYRTSWTHLSQADQVNIINASVELLKNEIATVSAQTTGLKTLSNTLLSENVLGKLVAQTQQSVTILDNEAVRELLPAGLLVYAGGSGGAGFLGNVKGAADLGLVVVPTEVTRVDTTDGASQTYFELDWNFVAIPHLYAGFGVGAGASASVGVGLIWGNLNKAADFGGVVAALAANAQFIAGADVGASTVHNFSSGQSFALGTVEFDFGPEASASADGEIGYVKSLGSQGVTQISKP